MTEAAAPRVRRLEYAGRDGGLAARLYSCPTYASNRAANWHCRAAGAACQYRLVNLVRHLTFL